MWLYYLGAEHVFHPFLCSIIRIWAEKEGSFGAIQLLSRGEFIDFENPLDFCGFTH